MAVSSQEVVPLDRDSTCLQCCYNCSKQSCFMNTKTRAGWLAMMLLCIASTLNAQKSTVKELLTRADRQFDLYSYNLAIQTYEQVLEEEKSNAHALARIGDCHYQLNRPEIAVEWYQKAQNTYNMEPDVPLRLGKALLQTGDYDGAKDQFLLYADTDEKIGRHFANVADYSIKNAKKAADWVAINEGINTSAADFGAAFYLNNIAFNSARTDIQPKGKPSADIQGGNTNHLFVSQRNPENSQLQKPGFLRTDVQNNRNEGPVSFSANGRRVAFSRNKFISGTRQIAETGMNMSIYTAEVENGTWKNIKAFLYNGSNYATGFPCLSPDGNKLYFASTQPGGFGGWDLYVSEWTSTGWSEPRNLGTPVNTPGNEVTPFFDGVNLYFSSDWHKGFGGLDVFMASMDRTEYANVIHLGAGINSARDDYGFIYNATDNFGYLTSTRSGGRGNEDIWMVAKKTNESDLAAKAPASTRPSARGEDTAPVEYSTPGETKKTKPARNETKNNRLHILVVNDRGTPSAGATIDLSDCYGERGVTDEDGKFYFEEFRRTMDCNVLVSKSGFRDANAELRDFGKENVKITLQPDLREAFRGYVLDARNQEPLRGVTVQVQLDDTEVETTTDDSGLYYLNVEPGETYLITYNKNGYIDAIVSTDFPFNSKNRIASVTLEKVSPEKPQATAIPANEQKVRPGASKDEPETKITKVIPRETAKTPATDKMVGYSIQLAALPEEPTDAELRKFESLTSIANLYVKAEGKMNKIRLGIYPTLGEAEEVLKTVLKNNTYKGAWVVKEHGVDETLVLGKENNNPVKPLDPGPVVKKPEEEPVVFSSKPSPSSPYYIRIAALSKPEEFDASPLYELGMIEKRKATNSPGMTIILIGSYSDLQTANRVNDKLLKMGYEDAFVVKDDQGRLVRQ